MFETLCGGLIIGIIVLGLEAAAVITYGGLPW